MEVSEQYALERHRFVRILSILGQGLLLVLVNLMLLVDHQLEHKQQQGYNADGHT